MGKRGDIVNLFQRKEEQVRVRWERSASTWSTVAPTGAGEEKIRSIHRDMRESLDSVRGKMRVYSESLDSVRGKWRWCFREMTRSV